MIGIEMKEHQQEKNSSVIMITHRESEEVAIFNQRNLWRFFYNYAKSMTSFVSHPHSQLTPAVIHWLAQVAIVGQE